MRRGALITQSALILVAITVIISLLIGLRNSSAGRAAPSMEEPVDLELVLLRLGIEPRALAAAGFSSQHVQAFAAAAFAELEDAANALAAADAAFAEARAEADHLQALVLSGDATGDDVQAMSAAVAARDVAATARDSVLEHIAETALATVPGSQAAALTAIRSARAWDLPAEYRAAERTQAEWLELREALAAERIEARYGYPLHEDAQTLLNEVRSEPAVSLAIANIQTHLAMVLLTWESAVQQPSE